MKASDLIGKNAIRTKPMNIGDGVQDYSHNRSPIHIVNATDSHIVYEYLEEYDKFLSGKKRILDCRWCDDNWIDLEFLLTPASEQLKAFDDIKLDA
jgi:hypothetical protein